MTKSIVLAMVRNVGSSRNSLKFKERGRKSSSALFFMGSMW
eukprot:CAMPEP_0119405306 /NCGR_PEP_ID=MMETSP1334-20130426/144332_1 /TAXON_ID=127549 /ORGANISM="Calcidiscus leptoporus, Strain RCC1130" /LENGTH=40 /DNA_ID= /DNA_START= /DNA_END= /DNA_ORIENTATION=